MTAHAWNVPKKLIFLGCLDNEVQTTTPRRWITIGDMCTIANELARSKRFDYDRYSWLQLMKRSLGELTHHERVALEHSFYMTVNW